MGYVDRLPSGRFRAVARINGKRVPIRGTHEYEYEAELAWQEAETRAVDFFAAHSPQQRVTPAAGGPTVHQHARAWWERKRGVWTRATQDNYATYVRFLAADPLGGMPVADVVRSDLEQAITRWVDAGASPATIAGRWRCLGGVLRDAWACGLSPRNPGDGLRLPTVPERADVYLTPAEIDALLASAAQLERRWAAFLLAAVDAGLRWGEAAALTPRAIGLDRVHVFQVIERTGGALRPYTKGRRNRVVPLPRRAAAALGAVATDTRASHGQNGFLFPAPLGGSLEYGNYRHRVWPAIRGHADGMRQSRVTLHDLRHTYGSRLAASGVPEKEIQQLMGHANVKTTRRYIHAAGHTVSAAWVAHALDGAASPLAAAG